MNDANNLNFLTQEDIFNIYEIKEPNFTGEKIVSIGGNLFIKGLKFTNNFIFESYIPFDLNDFILKTYGITINPNGGIIDTITYYENIGTDEHTIISSTKTVVHNLDEQTQYQIMNGTTITLSVPIRQGYVFSGYTINIDDKGSLTSCTNNDSTFKVLDGTATITANWIKPREENIYRFIYNTNGTNLNFDNLSYSDASAEDLWMNNSPFVGKNYGDNIELATAYNSNSYYYVNGNQTRFAVGWTLTPYGPNESPSIDYTFSQRLTIDDIMSNTILNNKAVATTFTPDDSDPITVYDVTLYLVWTSNYKPLEQAVANFQSAYMEFNDGQTPVRNGFYADAPSYAVLPAVSDDDIEYINGEGMEVETLYYRATEENKSDAYPGSAHMQYDEAGMYTWVVGALTDSDAAWTGYADAAANDFADVSDVNTAYLSAGRMLVIDPAAAYANGELHAQSSTINTNLNNARMIIERPEETGIFENLTLKDADIEYCMSTAEMARYSAEEYESVTSGETYSGTNHCVDNIGYTPNETAKEYLEDSENGFNATFEDRYPDCGTTGHMPTTGSGTVTQDHSFEGVIALCDVVFAPYAVAGQDVTTLNIDTAFSSEVAGSIYTAESVRELYEMVYGSSEDGLYYDVQNLRRPSQWRVNDITAQIASKRHELEIKGADYSEFSSLLSNYIKDTWGSTITDLENGVVLDNFAVLATYFEDDDAYNDLQTFLHQYFEEPGIIRSADDPEAEGAIVGLSVLEQDYINGKNGTPRTGANDYYDISDNMYDENHVALTTKYGYAEGTICDLLCDLIDALNPGPGNYFQVYKLLADSVATDAQGHTIGRPLYEGTPYPTPYPVALSESTQPQWDAKYKRTNSTTGRLETGIPWNANYLDVDWLNNYYTTASVAVFKTCTDAIDWSYTRVQQGNISNASNPNSIVSKLTAAIRNLEPKNS